MILLRLISWPYARKHMLRTVLTMAGIVLGVAVFVGMHTANQSIIYAFNSTVDRIAGRTELQVTSGETGFDEAVLDRVQAATAAIERTRRLRMGLLLSVTPTIPAPSAKPMESSAILRLPGDSCGSHRRT